MIWRIINIFSMLWIPFLIRFFIILSIDMITHIFLVCFPCLFSKILCTLSRLDLPILENLLLTRPPYHRTCCSRPLRPSTIFIVIILASLILIWVKFNVFTPRSQGALWICLWYSWLPRPHTTSILVCIRRICVHLCCIVIFPYLLDSTIFWLRVISWVISIEIIKQEVVVWILRVGNVLDWLCIFEYW